MTSYRYKTKPYRHQVVALKKLMRNGGGGLFMEMGTGKTKPVIDFCAAMAVKRNPRLPAIRALVVCPLSVISVWHDEIATHDPFADNDFMGVDWRIVNYDKVWRPHVYDELAEWITGHVIIADESHKIKTPGARRSRALHMLGQRAAFRIIMTGTPIAKNPLDLYSQFKFLEPAVFGTEFAQFKRQYAIYGGPGGHEVKKFINLKQLNRKIQPLTYQITKEECLDLPAKTHELIRVDLDESRKVYDQLARHSIVEFEGEEVITPIVLTRLLRLSQLTGGWLKGDNYKRVGKEKQRVTGGLLENMYESDVRKVVIFCRFLRELGDVGQLARSHGYKLLTFHGGADQSRRERALAAFDATSTPTVFAAQISTGSLGISLTSASNAIFYSHTYNYAEFEQACDRLHRLGQQHPVTYYHLLARDSVDELVWMALKTKRNLAKLVLKYPKLIKGGAGGTQ